MRDHDARLRRLERGAAAALTVFGALLLMGQLPPPRGRGLEGDSFTLRDAQGTVRAVLGMQDGTTVALTLKSAAGEDRVALLVRADGTSLVRALDRGGRAGVELGGRAGGTGVAVLDRGGRTRATMATDGDGASIAVLGSEGKTGATLAATSLTIGEGSGRPRLTLRGDNTPSVILSDVGGRQRATLDVAANGTTRLDLTDPSGRPRAAMTVSGGGSPTIVLNDDAAKPIFEAPR